MDALGINLGYLLMQILLFAILLTVMVHYAYKPIINTLEERKARIAKGLEDARQAAMLVQHGVGLRDRQVLLAHHV